VGDRDNADNIMGNIEAIKMLSGMMSSSGGGSDTERILNAISTAKSLGLLGSNSSSNSSSNNSNNVRDGRNENVNDILSSENNEYINGQDSLMQNDGIKAVKAAIPFLNRDYQKHLFLAVKLLEMNEEFDRGSMSLQCQSIKEGTDDEQREAMLKAVRGQIGNEVGRKLDVVLKMMEAKRIAAKLQ